MANIFPYRLGDDQYFVLQDGLTVVCHIFIIHYWIDNDPYIRIYLYHLRSYKRELIIDAPQEKGLAQWETIKQNPDNLVMEILL